MRVKRKTYSADFKAKLVLEVLNGEKTLNAPKGIFSLRSGQASKYEVLPASLKSWKKHFLDNMSLAFDVWRINSQNSYKSSVVKEYKSEIETLQKDKDELAKKVGNLTIEKDFLEGGVPLEGKS